MPTSAAADRDGEDGRTSTCSLPRKLIDGGRERHAQDLR